MHKIYQCLRNTSGEAEGWLSTAKYSSTLSTVTTCANLEVTVNSGNLINATRRSALSSSTHGNFANEGCALSCFCGTASRVLRWRAWKNPEQILRCSTRNEAWKGRGVGVSREIERGHLPGCEAVFQVTSDFAQDHIKVAEYPL